MKIVINTDGFGLDLTATEMQMFCDTLGFTLREQGKGGVAKGSRETWFNGVNWEEFRTHPALIEAVEQKQLGNKLLEVWDVDTDDWDMPIDEWDWYIHTDWHSYESLVLIGKYHGFEVRRRVY